MKHTKLFRAIWFQDEKERSWLALQVATYYSDYRKSVYSDYRKSVVLYALKRLGLIFRISFTSLDGNVELRALADHYEQFNKRHWFSFLLPEELHRNPLQIVSEDHECAEDDYASARESSQSDIPTVIPLSEHATVSDYVQFIVEYDKMCRVRFYDRLTLSSWSQRRKLEVLQFLR